MLTSGIMCGCLLAVIEGVGIGMQRVFAESTKLEVCEAFRIVAARMCGMQTLMVH